MESTVIVKKGNKVLPIVQLKLNTGVPSIQLVSLQEKAGLTELEYHYDPGSGVLVTKKTFQKYRDAKLELINVLRDFGIHQLSDFILKIKTLRELDNTYRWTNNRAFNYDVLIRAEKWFWERSLKDIGEHIIKIDKHMIALIPQESHPSREYLYNYRLALINYSKYVLKLKEVQI